jgi:hypothetical protein
MNSHAFAKNNIVIIENTITDTNVIAVKSQKIKATRQSERASTTATSWWFTYQVHSNCFGQLHPQKFWGCEKHGTSISQKCQVWKRQKFSLEPMLAKQFPSSTTLYLFSSTSHVMANGWVGIRKQNSQRNEGLECTYKMSNFASVLVAGFRW